MGACCNDLFKLIYDKYGKEFITLIVCEDGKICVTDEFGKARTEFTKVFDSTTKQATTLVDSKTAELTKVYDSEKSKIAAIPGAISALEKSQGKTIDELSGFNSLKAEITKVKTDALNKMNQEKGTIEGKMTTTESSMLSSIDSKRPKISEFDSLPAPLQKDLVVKGQTQFATEIKNNRQGIISSITGQFGPSALGNAFGKFNPSNQLNNIVGSAGGKFASALGAGNPLGGGGIGGFL